jgi:pyruvate,water dikinase
VPTFGERVEVIRAAIDRARAVDTRSMPRRSTVGRAAADLAERDDIWFAKAQLLVRHALLRTADERGLDRDDICWLSLDDLVGGAPISVEDAHRRASAARAASQRAAKWAMPLVVGGEIATTDREVLHGFGSDARATGRVRRFATLASAIAVGAGDVIVTRAITPALAVFVVGCAAIVSETGGPLDHGAAIARELGIPFIVGCRDAWSLLTDGMIVTIDHDRVVTT